MAKIVSLTTTFFFFAHARTHTATVRRVVLTSSFRSVFGLGDEFPKGHVYTVRCVSSHSLCSAQPV